MTPAEWAMAALLVTLGLCAIAALVGDPTNLPNTDTILDAYEDEPTKEGSPE